jgi:hypothetical protein
MHGMNGISQKPKGGNGEFFSKHFIGGFGLNPSPVSRASAAKWDLPFSLLAVSKT